MVTVEGFMPLMGTVGNQVPLLFAFPGVLLLTLSVAIILARFYILYPQRTSSLMQVKQEENGHALRWRGISTP